MSNPDYRIQNGSLRLRIARYFDAFRPNIATKLIGFIGIVLILCISTWSYFNIKYYKEKLMEGVMAGADKLTNTIRLGAHYAMMTNSRDDINQIINNVSRQKDISNIRIYNKKGQIKFSNTLAEQDSYTDIGADSCNICHRADPPLVNPDLKDRVRIISSPDEDTRLLSIVTPILNEPACSQNACHYHDPDNRVLGSLDLVISLDETERAIVRFEQGIIVVAFSSLLLMSAGIVVIVSRFLNSPIKKLISSIRFLEKGNYDVKTDIDRTDEIGELAAAFDNMRREIFKKELELKFQRDEYQELFERAPCIITVQDRDYRIIRCNRAFSELFGGGVGDYCYRSYKGRDERCPGCPVEETFKDGEPHYSEEMVYSKEESQSLHWIVKTVPIREATGEISAVMEMCLDISYNKMLEKELASSVQKYYAIFNNIPNSVFVLDIEELKIKDCNESAAMVYGFHKKELLNRSFLNLFANDDQQHYSFKIRTSRTLHTVRQLHKSGRVIFTAVRISPSEYEGKKVLLVTTSDITERLEVEQKIGQASKMSTLGEMATGVAHELNQPLSVIKTASNFLMKKIRRNEEIDKKILLTMASEIDGHVDRATKIMNHMRQFGRKSDMTLEKIQVNEVLRRAFEFFSSQLKLREIEVVWDIDENLPVVLGDANRLEQVFVNLLINARDAIEEKCAAGTCEKGDRRITLETRVEESSIEFELRDTGKGIPKANLDKVFEPFFTTKQVGKGTGLGLYISYGIIRDLGGSIRAESVEGEGAAFIITLPIPDREI